MYDCERKRERASERERERKSVYVCRSEYIDSMVWGWYWYSGLVCVQARLIKLDAYRGDTKTDLAKALDKYDYK